MKNFLYRLHNKIFCTTLIVLLMANLCGASHTRLVSAASTSPDADMSGKSTISVTLKDEEGNTINSGELTLYHVASLSDDKGGFSYKYTDDFKDMADPAGAAQGGNQGNVSGNASGFTLDENELMTEVTNDSVALATGIAEYVSKNGVTGITVKNTSGTVTFDNLEFGLYLIVQTGEAEGYTEANPFLVSLPIEENNTWVYEVDASPKVGLLSSTIVTTTEDAGTTEEVSGTTEEKGETTTEEAGGTTDETNVTTEEDDTTEEAGGTTDTTNKTTTTGTTSKMSSGSNTKLPQTGQLIWPIFVLAGLGGALFIMGAIMVCLDKRTL